MTRRQLLFPITVLLACTASAQSHEWRAGAHSAHMHFSGTGATGSTRLLRTGNVYAAENPFGSKAGAGFGLEISYLRMLKSNFLFGMAVGYESAQAKADVSAVVNTSTGISTPMEGEIKINQRQLIFRPSLGYRIPFRNQSVRIQVFPEVNPILYVRESGYATTETPFTEYRSGLNRQTIDVDIRLGGSAGYYWNRWGVDVQYAAGFADNNRNGSAGRISNGILRIGLSFKVNN